MTQSKRYVAHYDELSRQRIAESAAQGRPVTLPPAAWGPQELTWSKDHPMVWAWVQWNDRPAERIAGWAVAWNDRVVIFGWDAEGGVRDTVVWRTAVTRRHNDETPPPSP